jgi:hypothetical protein
MLFYSYSLREDSMKTITQHIPNFFDGFTRKKGKFNTEEELYNIDFVKRWKEDPDFLHFSIEGNTLITIKKGGPWIVGHIEEVG